MTNSKSRVIKVFAAGQAKEAKDFAPGSLVVWRKHAANDGAYLSGNLRQNAQDFLARYLQEAEVAARNMGIAVDDLVDGVVIESLNEVIPSGDEKTGAIHPRIPLAIEFDLHFEELVRQMFNGHVGAGLATVAVGNPGRHEYDLLTAIAKVCHEHRLNKIAYHAYWPSNQEDARLRNRDELALVQTWPYYGGRWTEWDKVFNQHGYYPEYYFGEGGICYAGPKLDSWSFGEGWHKCGSIEDYIFQIDAFDDLVAAWNALHGDRAHGLAVFTYGGWGWEKFDFEPGDILLLMNWFMRKYGL